jgi:hypothetical protein
MRASALSISILVRAYKLANSDDLGNPWRMSDQLLRCRSCHARTSLIAGTVFEGTRKPLRTWFIAMWFVTSQKNGVSALGLQRVLGLGGYETAWT